MESFRIDRESGRDFVLKVEAVQSVNADLMRTLKEIDLQTFAESTFSTYTAAAFLTNGRVFLLRADDVVIGSCVCMRAWERPNEAMVLSMGIRPGWRGRGIGQGFVRGVLDRLRTRGMRSVSLLVGKENRRAIKLYEDVGFEVVEHHQMHPNGHDELLLMRAQLVETEVEGQLIRIR